MQVPRGPKSKALRITPPISDTPISSIFFTGANKGARFYEKKSTLAYRAHFLPENVSYCRRLPSPPLWSKAPILVFCRVEPFEYL